MLETTLAVRVDFGDSRPVWPRNGRVLGRESWAGVVLLKKTKLKFLIRLHARFHRFLPSMGPSGALESGFNRRHIFIAHIYAYSYTFRHRSGTSNGLLELRRALGRLCAGAGTRDR